MSTKYDSTAIEFDPFAGDDGDERVLQDEMVKARKRHACFHCAQTINVGDVHRSRRAVFDGDMMSWRWCPACCAAMVIEMNADRDSETYAADVMAFESRNHTLRAPTGDSSHG